MRSENIQLPPELAPITSNMVRGSSCSLIASAIASQAAARFTPASMLFTIFALEPSPGRSLMRTRVPEIASSTTAALSNAASAPASIMLMLPARALAGPPEQGASRK